MQSSDNKRVGERLLNIITHQRIKSKRAFAISIDADPSFMDKIIKGKATLTEKIAKKIADVYGINEEWLWSESGDMWNKKGPESNFIEKSSDSLSVLAEAMKLQS